MTHAQRSTAKMVSYGLAYGMEAYGLTQRLGVPVEEAAGILEAFFAAFPSVKRLHGRRRWPRPGTAGYTRTAFGRRRPLPDLDSPQLPGAPGGRAPGHERRDPGPGRRPVQGGPGPAGLATWRSSGLASDWSSRSTTRSSSRWTPGEEDEVAALTEAALTGAADLTVPLKVAMAWGSSWAEAKGA